MRRLLTASFATLAILAACSQATTGPSGVTTAPFTPEQDAYLVLKAATAIENEAAAIKATPGLSELAKTQITIGMTATSNGVQEEVRTMLAGGSLSSAILAGLEQAAASSISSLAGILAAQHGSTATITQIAVASSLPALENAAVMFSVTMQLRGGFQPTQAYLDQATADLNAAAGQ